MSSTAAFLSREQLDGLSIVTFSVNNTFQIPESLLSCSIQQFQNVLSFASNLLDLENYLTNDYKRSTKVSKND